MLFPAPLARRSTKKQMWGMELCAAGAQQQAGQQKAGEDRKREMRVCLL
jgi:hypothetical protein